MTRVIGDSLGFERLARLGRAVQLRNESQTNVSPLPVRHFCPVRCYTRGQRSFWYVAIPALLYLLSIKITYEACFSIRQAITAITQP